MVRIHTPLWVITLAALALQTPALAAGKPADREDIKAYALQRCLDDNYTHSGKYAPDQLRDRSYLLTTYAMDNAKAGATDRLHRFVDANTAGLDKREVPMKDEARRGLQSHLRPMHGVLSFAGLGSIHCARILRLAAGAAKKQRMGRCFGPLPATPAVLCIQHAELRRHSTHAHRHEPQ